MKKALIMLLLTLGCTSSPSYKEGTTMQLGAYVPYDGNIMGIEVLNYLNGCKVTCMSNQTFEVERDFAATNDYFFGMVKTEETTHTKVKVQK